MTLCVGLKYRKSSLDTVTRQAPRSLRFCPQPDLTFFSEIDYKGHFLVKCLRQDVEEDLHLQRTGRTDPMEASKHIVLALETSFPRPYAAAHVEIYAQVCVSMCSILGYRDYENKLTINST